MRKIAARRTCVLLLLLLPFFAAKLCLAGAAPERSLTWDFPLPRTHTGILLGNGTQGLMIWGGNDQLNVTIGRAGFWDHRNSMRFAATTTYKAVRKLLEARDEEGLKRAFRAETSDRESRPYQLGAGRLEIILPEGWTLGSARLLLERGIVEVTVLRAGGAGAVLRIRQSVFHELSWLEVPPVLRHKLRLRIIPSWDFNQKALERRNVKPPTRWATPTTGGYLQTLPEDEPLAVACSDSGSEILIATALGRDAEQRARSLAARSRVAALAKESEQWWSEYWHEAPRISLPDPVLQEIADYGLYKQACCTPPHGVACSLQGPFMEEYQIPPWSNDYHFNINIQMIYWPSLPSNRAEHLAPLWKMILAWLPELRENAEHFFETKGAVTLPHAVDDRGRIPGFFWTGMIDHASTAWVAQMAWLHYRYTLDREVLEQIAWPLLKGAFEGYWAMFERGSDRNGAGELSIPVSVSPEFRGSRMDAWGRNASFQLAACHMLAAILPQAAPLLGERIDPRWEQVRKELPPYSTIEAEASLENPGRRVRRIALWEGMDLLQSHRHHSHLASIYPFCTIDPFALEHARVVGSTIDHWTYTGAGAWSGWCVPWAATINARLGNIEAAVAWLHYWKEIFTNEGRGTLHNANFPGLSIIRSPVWSKLPPGSPMTEIMQLDAGFGALTAVFELLVQNRSGEIVVLPSLHNTWRQASFDGVATEGAFRLGATVNRNRVEEVRVKSLKGGRLRLRHGLGGKWLLNGAEARGDLLERECRAGEKLVLTRKP